MNRTRMGPALTLDQWSGRSWTDGYQTESLAPYDTLIVRTRNSSYEITILTPATGEVLVRGGQFFPEFTRATVAGSSLRGTCLKVRGIYTGFYLELLYAGQTIRTTRIQAAARTGRSVLH